MEIDLNEAAKLLKVHPSTLQRWVKKGMLNSRRIEDKICFDRDELIKFIKKTNFSQVEYTQLAEISAEQQIDDRLILTKAVSRGIFTKLSDNFEREGLFIKVVDLLAYVNEINFPRELLVAKLIEREEEISTAIGGGIALPHPKNTPELHFDNSIIGVVSLFKPLILNPSCTELNDLFFFLFSKNPMEHLKLLSTIAKIVAANPNLKRQINHLESRKELVDLLETLERKLLGI